MSSFYTSFCSQPISTFGMDFHIDLPECGAPGDLLFQQKANRQRFPLRRRRRD